MLKRFFYTKFFYTILIALLLFIISVNLSMAMVKFSEINYDPIGSDTGHEWVEVYNDDMESIDFTKYKFCEGGSCHNIKAFNESKEIEKNTFAILSSKPDIFLKEHENFSGIIFKSSFSLKNTEGEKLELEDSDKQIISVLEYNPEIGGKNGDTLSVIDGDLVNSLPTPGEENIFKEKEEKEDNEDAEENNNTSDNNNDNNKDEESSEDEDENIDEEKNNDFLEDETLEEDENIEKKNKTEKTYVEINNDNNNSDTIDGQKKIKVEIEKNNIIIAGADSIYNSKVFKLSDSNVENEDDVKYFWNFGDGQTSSQKNPKHVYHSSGEYVIYLKALINGWSGQTKVLVKVLDSPVIIKDVDYNLGKIILENKSKYVIDISGFKIKTMKGVFIIPEDTYINKKSELNFSLEILKLKFEKKDSVSLTYSNDKIVNVFDIDIIKEVKEKIQEVQNKINEKEQELLDIENKNKINQKKLDKQEKISKEEEEIERLKLKVQKEKVLFELEKLRIKKQELEEETQYKKEKRERIRRKELEKELEKQKKEEEKNKEKLNKEIENIEEENNNNQITDNNNEQVEEVIQLQDNEKNIEKEKKSWISEIFLDNIFEFILGFLMIIVLSSILIYKKYKDKNIKTDGEDNDSKKDWNIEEIK